MKSRSGYVLVGGKSSRFGRDKALADVDGKPMAAVVADRVREAAGEVTLVGAPERYRALGYRTIADPTSDFGPAAGILAALEDSSAEWNLIVACDMPRLRVDFLELLLECAASRGQAALVPRSSDGRLQPLCAVYSKSLAPAFRSALEQGQGKVAAVLEGQPVHYLEPPEYAHIDPTGEVFRNVNRQEDLPGSP